MHTNIHIHIHIKHTDHINTKCVICDNQTFSLFFFAAILGSCWMSMLSKIGPNSRLRGKPRHRSWGSGEATYCTQTRSMPCINCRLPWSQVRSEVPLTAKSVIYPIATGLCSHTQCARDRSPRRSKTSYSKRKIENIFYHSLFTPVTGAESNSTACCVFVTLLAILLRCVATMCPCVWNHQGSGDETHN